MNQRQSAHRAVSAYLSKLSDARLVRAVASATSGGRSGELDVDGTPVFVKRVPLTEVDLANPKSTANLFGVPPCYQYGPGSWGAGAWRELAAHQVTTGWVLRNEHDAFPLAYHWRVLPDGPPDGLADEFGGIDGAVAHWNGSPAVRARLEGLSRSRASVVLFVEHLPWTLADWLERHSGQWVSKELECATLFLRSRGLIHFDPRFHHIRTDGERLCFTGFGLALSTTFELSNAESAFLSAHLMYDASVVAGELVRYRPETAERYGGVAAVLDDFHRRLAQDRRTPFPASRLMAAWRRARPVQLRPR